MTLVNYSPSKEYLESFLESGFFGAQCASSNSFDVLMIKLYRLILEVPGLDKDDIKLEYDEKELSINAKNEYRCYLNHFQFIKLNLNRLKHH